MYFSRLLGLAGGLYPGKPIRDYSISNIMWQPLMSLSSLLENIDWGCINKYILGGHR